MIRTALALTLLALTAAAAQHEPPTPAQIEAMLAKTRPGPEHQPLAAMVGRWRQEITWQMGPTPVKAAGTATNRLILGGRFLVSERQAENPAGEAIGVPTIEAQSVYGFDRRTGRYTIIELDTMGTYWVSATGPMTAERTIVMAGETLDGAQAGAQPRRFEMVLQWVDADTYLTRIVFKFPGQPDVKLVETVSRRIE